VKKIALFFLVFIYVLPFWAQEGFQYVGKKNKLRFPFQLINNLVFIPIKVNGAELTFLLDTGVEETILFGIEETKEINLKNTQRIKLSGLGNKDYFEGLRSTGNLLEGKGLKSENHLLYIILDSEFNLSSFIGIPVNGIIGYSYFKNNVVEINYAKRKIMIYKNTQKNLKKIEKRFVKVPVIIEKAKLYVMSSAMLKSKQIPLKLLIDNGNSDAIWLFQNDSRQIEIPEKNFTDYLGQGLSGDVEGKRAKIPEFSISDFKFKNPIVSFPDSLSIKNITMVSDRAGSVGGEILRRFSVVFDYSGSAVYLRKNRAYNAPFTYNKSGLELRHAGMQWVNEKVSLKTVPLLRGTIYSESEESKSDFKYEYKLRPVYEISNIRKKSAALQSGLQVGDIIVSVNNNPAYKYTLQEINSFLKEGDEEWIELEVERNKEKIKVRFQLVDLL
jgi:hypothetical protein